MLTILHTTQIVSALLLIALILIQRTSGDMGGTGDSMSVFQTRRGAERFFFILTVVVGIVFAGASLAVIVLTR
jgi:protein translocase SecG subunit